MKTQNNQPASVATKPKFSVVVPVYNIRESFFRECVESVLAQTFADFELILVDDGSTNDAETRCDAFAKKDPRIRAFHKPNGGVSSARNMGIREARGEYIAFLDSDDLWRPTFLEKIESLSRAFPQLNIFCVAFDTFKTSPTDGSRITLSKTRLSDFDEGDIIVCDPISYTVKKNTIGLLWRTGSYAFRAAWLKEEWGGGIRRAA